VASADGGEITLKSGKPGDAEAFQWMESFNGERRILLDIAQSIVDIIRINEHIYDFWSNGGWADEGASDKLSISRLDWQISLSKALHIWLNVPQQDENDGRLILAWANLGALVEGTMKWFLCVYYDDYLNNPIRNKVKIIEPDFLMFEKIKKYFLKNVWTPKEADRWKPYLDLVQGRRNAIHAYRNRDIGDFSEFQDAVIKYRSFLLYVEGSVPYPNEQYAYPFDIYEMRMNER
jgi:hypothetical protein